MFELYSSVEAVVCPPASNATVPLPAPAPNLLAVARVPGTVVQLVPSYSSVVPVVGLPPKIKPRVKVPAPLKSFLAVFIGFIAVQVVPSYSSLFETAG